MQLNCAAERVSVQGMFLNDQVELILELLKAVPISSVGADIGTL